MSSYSLQGMIDNLVRQGITDPLVLEAMAKISRSHFVTEAMRHRAYNDDALPIGHAQTISQPFTVAKMTELLKLTPQMKVLEVGTGSGYQTAILATILNKVYTVERIRDLQWSAKRRLRQLDIYNVESKYGDGWQGWALHAPYDAIIVTAAAPSIPEQLLAQLADGGRLIIPLGDQPQKLVIIEKQGQIYNEQVIMPVRFVPLIAGDLT